MIERRGWLSEATLSEFLGLTQLLPGPSSSQTGFLIGLGRGGLLGGVAAWLGFTLPSAVLMTLFAAGVKHAHGPAADGALRGLGIAAVAVVANAVMGMFLALCPDWPRRALALAAAVFVFLNSGGLAQIAALLVGAVVGWGVIRSKARVDANDNPLPVSRVTAAVCLILFGVIFASLEIAAQSGSPNVRLLDAFYRTGSLVFGGGHVVLPLLNEAVVRPGWVTPADFLAGYGAAQTIPGPLFTFAAYLGFTSLTPLHGVGGAVLCLLCIFLPGLLLAAAAAPFWSWLRRHEAVQFALSGVNAVVVGLLLSALFHAALQVMTSGGVQNAVAVVLALIGFVALWKTRVSPVIVVLATAAVSAIYGMIA